jgi:hypothetical protein
MAAPKHDEPPPGRGPWLKLALLALFIGVVVAFFAVGGQNYLTLDAIKANRDALLRFTEAHFAAAIVIAFLIYAGAVAFSLPGALILSLAMGFVFGRWVGAGGRGRRRRGDDRVPRRALHLRRRRAQAAGALGERSTPASPKTRSTTCCSCAWCRPFRSSVNLAPAFTSIPLRTYVLATFIGIIPGTFVFVNLGRRWAGSIRCRAWCRGNGGRVRAAGLLRWCRWSSGK